jgi:hypothetical protein
LLSFMIVADWRDNAPLTTRQTFAYCSTLP